MTATKRVLCDVYKTRRKDEMYLYVEKKEGMARVPDELKEMFGKPELALTLLLTPEKNLGRADAEKVLADICRCLRQKNPTCWISSAERTTNECCLALLGDDTVK